MRTWAKTTRRNALPSVVARRAPAMASGPVWRLDSGAPRAIIAPMIMPTMMWKKTVPKVVPAFCSRAACSRSHWAAALCSCSASLGRYSWIQSGRCVRKVSISSAIFCMRSSRPAERPERRPVTPITAKTRARMVTVEIRVRPAILPMDILTPTAERRRRATIWISWCTSRPASKAERRCSCRTAASARPVRI